MSYSLLFPGQGSQYVGMSESMCSFSGGSKLLLEANDVLSFDIGRIMKEGPPSKLMKTSIAQPAILLYSIAVLEAFKNYFPKIIFASAIGHSLGEYSALVAAHVLKLKDALLLVHRRGELMENAVPEGSGSMAAIIGLPEEIVASVMKEFQSDENSPLYAAVANINGPGQIVISGMRDGVLLASKKLNALGAKKIVPLSVSGPFHCALMKSAALGLREELLKISFKDASFPVIMNASASLETNGQRIKELLIEQLTNPVLFSSSILNAKSELIENGFLELGPKNVLSGLIKRIDPSSSVMSIGDKESLLKFGESLIHEQ